jgi:hypothetical protein
MRMKDCKYSNSPASQKCVSSRSRNLSDPNPIRPFPASPHLLPTLLCIGPDICYPDAAVVLRRHLHPSWRWRWRWAMALQHVLVERPKTEEGKHGKGIEECWSAIARRDCDRAWLQVYAVCLPALERTTSQAKHRKVLGIVRFIMRMQMQMRTRTRTRMHSCCCCCTFFLPSTLKEQERPHPIFCQTPCTPRTPRLFPREIRFPMRALKVQKWYRCLDIAPPYLRFGSSFFEPWYYSVWNRDMSPVLMIINALLHLASSSFAFKAPEIRRCISSQWHTAASPLPRDISLANTLKKKSKFPKHENKNKIKNLKTYRKQPSKSHPQHSPPRHKPQTPQPPSRP